MKGVFLSSLLLLSFVSVSAQGLKAVRWSTELQQVSDTEFDLIITAELQHGWHIYAQELKEVIGPVATVINIESQDGQTLIGKAEEHGTLIEGYDALMGTEVRKYKEEVQFIQRLECEADVTWIKGSVRYMACDAQRCLPPKTTEFNLAVVRK